jgi:CBS domain containing-hemolysin-like protein
MAQEGPSPTPWWRRALRVGLLSFVLAVLVSYTSDVTLESVPSIVAFLVVLLLISIGVTFDILGTSVTAAQEVPLNAMAAKKVAGAKQALWLVRNADTVSNFTNDVVGDVTGAVTGAAGATVAMRLTRLFEGGALAEELMTLGLVGLIAGLTVGGKAAGKTFAMEQATNVVVMAGRVIQTVEQATGRSFTGGRGPNSSKRRTT